MGARLVLKLFAAQARLHPARLVLTAAAVVASACAVAWVVSGYDALVSQFDESATKYLGRYDLIVVPAGGGPGAGRGIAPELIEQLGDDRAVREVKPITQSRATVTAASPDDANGENILGQLVGSKPPVRGAPPMDPVVVATEATEGPYEMVDGDWLSPGADKSEAVLSRGAAERLGVGVGDRIDVTTIANRVRLEVVGVIEQAPQAMGRRGGGGGSSTRARGGQPTSQAEAAKGGERAIRAPDNPPVRRRLGPSSSDARHGAGPVTSRVDIPMARLTMPATHAVYVRTATADLANGFHSPPAILQVALRDGYNVAAFRTAWEERLSSRPAPFRIVDFDSVREGFEQSGSVSQKLTQAYSATALAALAAVFIIFSTLSMGVSERARELAMLRAVALTRGQVAALIAVESLALAVIGWLGGLAAGWVVLSLAAGAKPDLFPNGARLGWACIGLTGASVLGGALAAAVLPAWRATRIRPIDAMAPPAVEGRRRWPLFSLVVGLFLIAVAPISVFFISIGDQARTQFYAVLSYPALLIGVACVTPALVIAAERYLGPAVASLLRIDRLLVRDHLSGNLWRTAGATLALSSGLALYASTQIWGYSMLQPFLPGPWLPDAIVGFEPVGLKQEDAERVYRVPGVISDRVLPLAVEQTKVAWPDGEVPRGMGMDNVTMIGLDPEEAFTDASPLARLAFVEGSRQGAAGSLATGTNCLVSEDYTMKTGLDVGDKLRLQPPNAPGAEVEYTISGVVSLPGWHWFTKFSGVRRHFTRTGGIVFAEGSAVRRDFHLPDRQEFFWLDLDPAVPLTEVEDSLQELAELNAGETFNATNVGQATAYRPFARLTATETIRTSISARADGVIWGMSQLPLVTLAITSLAVVNTIAALVRARTWELAILRAVGTTRGELVRLVIAESILIAVVTCVVSLAFGLVAGWCGVGMSRYSGAFFGGPPVFYIPWRHLALGFGATLGLCLLAALWPAIRTARTEPLTLLQAGRSAT